MSKIGSPSAMSRAPSLSPPDPVEYEDMDRNGRIAWQVNEALGWHGDINKAALNLAAQLVDADELIAELVAALEELLVGCEYETIMGITDWHRISMPKKQALTAARTALASAGRK